MKLTKIRLAAVPVLMASLLFSTAVPAYAATKDDKELIKVVDVSLGFSNPEPGDDVDEDLTDEVSVDDGICEIYEAEFTTKKATWEYGDKPVVKIKVKIPKEEQDSYKFRSGKVKLHLDKGDASVEKSEISNSSTSATITLYLKQVTGKTDTTSDHRWEGNFTASWDKVDTAQSYTVRLYRNSTQVVDVDTYATYVNLASYMTTPGKYSFRVRSNAGKAKDNSSFSERSDYKVITAENLPTELDLAQGQSTAPEWRQDGDNWVLVKDGTKLHNTWYLDTDGSWYYLGADSYMKTGWFTDSDGNKYYLNPEKNGPQGAMMTGWITYHDRTYYLNPNEGAPRGSMVHGTTMNIDGQDYTFTEDGFLQQPES